MKLSEGPTELIDHKVIVMMPEEIRDECTIKGILREVGSDYVMVSSWDDIAEFPLPGQCYIKIDTPTPIVHAADCRQCRR